MKDPRVSVIIAAWNRADFIGRAIQSVIGQTFTDWELIIVDDGSPDRTHEVVQEWAKKDNRVKYFRIAHTGRIATVSNVALGAARGEFVAIVDDDDWWTDKRKLEKQVAFLDAHPDYVACGGWFVVVNVEGKEIAKVEKPQSDAAIRRIALFANPIANSTVMFRRGIGFYDETLRQFADWDFWLKVGRKGKLCNLPEYFSAYRMWGGGSSFMFQRQNAKAALHIVRRYRKDYAGFFRAVVLAVLYQCYSYLPLFIRKTLNSLLSRLKKYLFSQ